MSTEATITETAQRWRGYVTDPATMAGEFRARDVPTERFSLVDAPSEIKAALATECVFLLKAKGWTLGEILSGAAIPARVPPVDKAPTMLVRAIAAVRAADLIKEARNGSTKPSKADIGALQGQALTWAQALDKDAQKRAARLAPVLIELARMRGEHGSLEDLMRQPVSVADIGAQFEALAHDPIADDVAAELGDGFNDEFDAAAA